MACDDSVTKPSVRESVSSLFYLDINTSKKRESTTLKHYLNFILSRYVSSRKVACWCRPVMARAGKYLPNSLKFHIHVFIVSGIDRLNGPLNVLDSRKICIPDTGFVWLAGWRRLHSGLTMFCPEFCLFQRRVFASVLFRMGILFLKN